MQTDTHAAGDTRNGDVYVGGVGTSDSNSIAGKSVRIG